MPDLPFDPKKLIFSDRYSGGYVTYGYYYENPRAYKRCINYIGLKKRFKDFLESSNKACFAAIVNTFNAYCRHNNGKAPNRIAYEINLNGANEYITNEDTMIRYIEMLKRNGMLPSYIDAKNVAKYKVVIFKIKGLSMRKLTVYMNMFRYFREHTQNIKNLLYLVEEL